jgi:hypothetical protein
LQLGCFTRAFASASGLTRRSLVVFEALDKAFVQVVAVQLGLSASGADDAHFQLKNFVTDVLVTRNWLSHSHHLSVTQVMRAMTSLLGTIRRLGCDPTQEQLAIAVITSCIEDVHAHHSPGSPVTLTVNSIACLFFTRSLQRLCKAMHVDDITKEALASNGPTSQEMNFIKDCVWDGRCYLYHGKCNRKSMALLVCIHAASRLLRNLGDSHADDANAIDDDIMHLLVRTKLCDGPKLIHAVYESHLTM